MDIDPQRRETDHKTVESVDRVWRFYADQIGIPQAASNESLPERTEYPGRESRPARAVAASVGRILAAVAVVVATAMIGTTLSPQFSSFPHAVDGGSSTSAARPAGGAETIRWHPAPSRPAGDDIQALAPMPSEMVRRLQPPSEGTVSRPVNPMTSSSTLVRPGPAETSDSLSVETKQELTAVVYRINFDSGTDRVNEKSRRVLDELAVAMKANVDWRVTIEGHTDAHGPADYNQALSERRAQAVRTYLQSAEIAPERLSAVGFGAARQVAPNDAAGNVMNRRVDIRRR